MTQPKKPTRRRLNVPRYPSQDLPDVAPGVEQDQTGRPGPSEPISPTNPAVDPQKDNPTSFPGERPPGPSDMGREPPPQKMADINLLQSPMVTLEDYREAGLL